LISVQVVGLKSTSSRDFSAIKKFSEAGGSQTATSYIATILEVVNNVNQLQDILKLSRVEKSNGSEITSCTYQGQKSSLKLKRKNYTNKTDTAILSLGYINYRNELGNPTEHKGFAADLISKLTELSAIAVTPYKNKLAQLTLDLNVQIPLGDYGTDGWTETVEIGSAQNVVYKVLQ
jgi:hypothetical protein